MQMENDRPRWPMQWVWLCLLSAMLLGVGAEAQQPLVTMGDFGDAPDHLFANYASVDPLQQANFPSALDLDEVPGYIVHHLPQERVLLGEEATLEEDAKLVDKDEDDGWVPGSFKPCQPARFLLKVTLPEGTPQGPIYLNALFDWNHDGRWLSASDCPADITVLPPPPSQGQQAAVPMGYLGTSVPEWGVQNLRLDLLPYELEPGFSGDILLPPMLTGALPGEMWIRFTITVEPVDEQGFMPFALGGGGWDGRGNFVYGESEDYFACLLVTDGLPAPGCPQALPDVVGLGIDVPGSDGSGTDTPPPDAPSPIIDLKLTKSVSDKRPNVGDMISYVITVTNDGPAPASNVTVKDPLPAALSTVSSAADQGLYDGSNLWVVGDLGVGQSANLQVTARVNQTGKHVNVAQVNSADQPDPDSTPANDNPAEDDQASAEIIVTNLFSDLAVSKSADVNPVALGSDITWTLTVTNNGPFDATNVLLFDPLPAGLTLVGATPSQGNCDAVINCNFGTLSVGASATVALEATVTSAFIGSTLSNTVSVSSDNSDPDPSSDSATVSVGVNRQSDLAITKADSSDPVLAGQTLTWAITVTNNGPADASNVQLSDPLPVGVSLVSTTPSQGSCNGALTCALGTLANGASATVTVQVQVNSAFAGSSLSNTASVTSDNSDPTPGNNSDTEGTTVNSQVDVAIVKTVNPASAVAGQDTVTWTLAVVNNGPSDAAAVVVSDPLPAGLTYVNSGTTQGSCNQSSGTVTCTLGTMANGASATITIQTSVNASATGTITNTATVTTTTPETNLANNVDSDSISVTTQADLSIVKTDSPDPVIAGNNLTYTLAVANNGPSNASSLSVSDPLPSGTTLVSATGTGWSCSGTTTVTCTRASLVVGAAPNITVTVTVSAAYSTSTISNTATVSSSTTDPVPGNNSDTEDTVVNTQANLAITKSDNPDPALAGANLTYTLNVSNAGPSNASNVSVSDPLPANTTLVSATGTGWSCSGTSTVTCTRASLAVGAAPAITVTVTITSGFAGTLNNTVTVSSSTTDPTPGNNSDTESTAVEAGVDLSIVKTDSPDPVIAGNQLTYTLSVANNGPGTANNVSVSDPLPANTTLVSATGTGWSCSGTTTVTCNLSGSLGVTSANPITVTVTVSAGFGGSTITNTTTVTTSNIDTNPANNTDSEDTTVVREADLAIVKTDNPDPVIAGNNLTYTLAVTNNGPSNASSLSVSDPLPSGTTLVSATGTGWSCSGTTTVTCTRASLAVGAAPNITVTVTVSAAYSTSTISNTATVSSSTTDPVPGNNSDTEDTTVNTQANLSMTKTDNPDPVLVGNNLTWTLAVSNAGPSQADSISVSDPLPSGTTLVSASGTGWSCSGTATVTCTRASLAVGAAPNITITVTVDAGFVGSTLSNTATVTATTTDPTPGNNSDTENTTVDQGVDLSITKTDLPDPAIAGNTLTYTLNVSNGGPADANSVSVSDPLPGGTTLVSATGTGWSCSGTTTITCTRALLAVGAAPAITVTVTVGASVAQGTVLSNTATVSTTSIDTNPANNSDTATTTVNRSADLSMAKTDSPDPVIAGNNLTYTLTVTNNGPSNAANVSVSDTLPAGVTLVSATGSGWSCSGTTTITCTRASGSVGALPAITVTVSVPASTAQGTVLNNSATVSSSTTDPNPGNETGNASTTVNTSADLIASKSSSVGTVRAGEQFNYIITVLNNGPSDAQNVQITDNLPAEVLFTAAFPSTGSCPTLPPVGNSGTVICNFGTVPSGGFVSVTLQVSVNSGFLGSSVTNSVTASSSTGDPSGANNTVNVITTVTQVSDIAVSIVDNPPNVNAGQQVTYTIDVVNNGPSDAQNVTATNTVPANVTLVSGPTVTVGSGSCTSGATISCSFGTLVNQGTVQAQYTVLVDQAYPTNSLSNSVTASTTTTDTQPGNNTDSTATTVSKVSDMNLVSLADSPDPVTRGSQLTYTVTVNNIGPSQSATTTVLVNLASGLTFSSATPSQGSCSPSGQTVTCNMGAVASGSTVTITVIATVGAGAPSTVLSTSSVSTSSTDGNSSNNSKAQATTVN